jgi:hypothetical protein
MPKAAAFLTQIGRGMPIRSLPPRWQGSGEDNGGPDHRVVRQSRYPTKRPIVKKTECRRPGIAIADGLVESGVIDLTADGAAVTEAGRAALQAAGIPLDEPLRSKRVYCRPCLDWSERRPHIAGLLGAALLERALAIGLVRRRKGSRVLDISGHDTDALRRLGFDGAAGRPPLVSKPD